MDEVAVASSCVALVDAGYLLAEGGRRAFARQSRSAIVVRPEALLAALGAVVAERLPGHELTSVRWYDALPDYGLTDAQDALVEAPHITLVPTRRAGRRQRNTLLHLYRDGTRLAAAHSADALLVVSADPEAALLFEDLAALGVRALSVTVAKAVAELAATAGDVVVLTVETVRGFLDCPSGPPPVPRAPLAEVRLGDVRSPAFVAPVAVAGPRPGPSPRSASERGGSERRGLSERRGVPDRGGVSDRADASDRTGPSARPGTADRSPDRPRPPQRPLEPEQLELATRIASQWCRSWLEESTDDDVAAVVRALPSLPRWLDAQLLRLLDTAFVSRGDLDPRIRKAGREAFVAAIRSSTDATA